MKTPKELIEAYAHDYRDMILSEVSLTEMLWSFWKEAEKGNRTVHFDQFTSMINSHGFKEWYISKLTPSPSKGE